MAHTGVEPKPTWRSIPLAVRGAAEAVVGAEVRRAQRVWGGYGPTPTYRLRLTDGRAAFFKAVGPASPDGVRGALAAEERIYRELSNLISPWAPAFRGAVQRDGWHALLLEDLGPKSVPPWTPALTRQVMWAYAAFHQATLGQPIPAWVPRVEQDLLPSSEWTWATDPAGSRPVAALAGDAAAVARHWLVAAAPTLAQAAAGMRAAEPPHALLHRDTRSDNLRWLQGRLRLVDWPYAAVGPLEEDVAGFVQSITVEGGPKPEQLVSWYAEVTPVRHDVLDAAVAALAGYFANQAWRPDPPGLPRLRTFQRRQLRVTLAWAAHRLALPPPTWLAGMAP